MTRPLLLLVDDLPEMALIVERYGRAAGYDTAYRGDVLSAWDFLQQTTRRPDLILLDVNLTGESGLELCPRVRSTPGLAGLPIALLGHWERPEDIAAGLDAGVDFVVTKDCVADPGRWSERLGEILSARDSRPGLESLSWREMGGDPGRSAGVASINRALRHPDLQRLGTEVVRAVLRRAVERAGRLSRAGRCDLTGWLGPEGVSLDGDRVGASYPPDAVAALAAATADQVWCLMGTAASASVRAALAASVAGNSG